MRKHGWQLPYHPLQVVAVAIFLALGFAFYVFFAPFVGKKSYQYVVMGIYTPLIISAFSLYIWCAAADPADTGVFKSKKYIKVDETRMTESKLGGDSASSITGANASSTTNNKAKKDVDTLSQNRAPSEIEKKIAEMPQRPSCFMALLALFPCAYICNEHDDSSGQEMSEDGMFYCSLCEVEVYKYSKHCRVCDKCVDRFDHHCRWLNNCIGKKNYRKFFTLMVSALLVLILQWSTGILVLICCFLERKKFEADIDIKLGSSFSLVPFVIVVAVCTILAMIATLPLVQLFFFHILLIKKGISTYDYIIALREQEQQGVGGQQSPQMSMASSLTGLSSASSFNAFNRGAWCTPPRLFLEDQYDVVAPDNVSVVSSQGKKTVGEEPVKKKNSAPVKISPWALARLNAEDVSKAAAEARKKSKILQPVVRRDPLERENSFGSSERRAIFSKPDSNNRKRSSKRIRLPTDLPLGKIPIGNLAEPSTSLAPRSNCGMSSSAAAAAIGSSPDSSLDSPDIHPFRISSSGGEEGRMLTGMPGGRVPGPHQLSRSTSDGYDASGGEDSDRVVPSSSRMNLQRSADWSKMLFRSDQDSRLKESEVFGGSSVYGNRKI